MANIHATPQYAFDFRATSLATPNGDGGGIDKSVGLAASINNESKAVWLTVTGMCQPTIHGRAQCTCMTIGCAAWESIGGPWLMPSPREMRGQVYAGIVHGATGIIYFAMDSGVTRDGQVMGIAPRALTNMSTLALPAALSVSVWLSVCICHAPCKGHSSRVCVMSVFGDQSEG